MKILVVDDDKNMLQAVTRFLAKAKGEHSVLSAESMESGYELALREQPQLLITDYDLPDGTGTVLIQKLSEVFGRTSPIRYILMSGHSIETLQPLLDQLNFVRVEEILNKPFSLTQLEKVI